MPIPDSYYYLDAQSQKILSAEPSGDLDVDALIRGEACYWINNSLHRIPKHKKLILSDWTIRNWPKDKIDKVVKELEQLIASGFSIYLNNSGTLITLDKRQLSVLTTELASSINSVIHPDELINAACKQLKCTHDEIEILDDYAIELLLNNQNPSVLRTLNVNAFSSLSTKNKKTLIQVIKQSKPPLQNLIIDTFYEMNTNSEGIQQHFPDAKIETDYTKAYLTVPKLIELQRKRTITQNGSTMNLEQFIQLNNLTIIKESVDAHYDESSRIDLEQALMQVAPSLKTADFTYLGNLINHLNLAHFNLSQLKELKVQLIKPDALQELLGACPTLNTLNLANSMLTEAVLNIKPKSQVHLKKITLSNCGITANNLQKLLEATDKLQYLSIHMSSLGEDNLKLYPYSLDSLKQINLITTAITSANLQNLLEASSELKTLSIISTSVQNPLNLRLNSLEKVEQLNLNDAELTTDNLQNLLEATSNLKKLSINKIKLSDWNSKCPIQLDCLEEIALTTHSLNNSNFIQSLMYQSTNLRKIELSSINQLNDDTILIQMHRLRHLEELHIINGNISNAFLNNLSAPESQLKKLHLQNCNFANKELTLNKENFSSLEELKLVGSTFSLSDLNKIIANTPNLKTLKLFKPLKITEAEIKLLEASAPHLHIQYSQSEWNIDSSPVGEDNIETTTPVDPPYNHQQLKDIKPPEKDADFDFQGKNKSKNQGMIIEKMSQYLTLTGQHLHAIPQISIGICNALTHYFAEHTDQQWEHFINSISKWNGKQETLTPDVTDHFEKLWIKVVEHQLNNKKPPQFLGNKIESYLNDLKETGILSNSWHAIAVKPLIPGQSYMVYDPNFVNGAREVAKKDLMETLHTAIGSLIAVESAHTIVPSIKNFDEFIEQGGLLFIVKCSNQSKILSQLPSMLEYSPKSLDGLLLRDLDGKPAWMKGLESPNQAVRAFTTKLLIQFYTAHAQYSELLQKSMEHSSGIDKLICVSALRQLQPGTSNNIVNELISVLSTAPDTNNYARQLETWRKKKSRIGTLSEYCQNCVAVTEIKKRLIQVRSTSELDGLRFGLEKHCQNTHRPVFYINSPKDLVCQTAYVKREGAKGFPQKPPGGRLFEFLQANKQGKAPVIIINYDHFNSDDIVRFNTLLDEIRIADGVAIPADAIILGLNNPNKPEAYQGSDFASRFDLIEYNSIPAQALEQAIPKIPVVEQSTDNPSTHAIINLFHSPNWETQLLGTWVLNKEHLYFEEGALVKALAQGSSIEIQNGLWESREFQRFWQRALLLGYIEHAGRRITIPKDLVLHKSEGYNWEFFKSLVTLNDNPEQAELLNPSRLQDFLKTYSCDNATQTLEPKPGLIKCAHGASLSVHLTRSLSDDEWALLLNECAQDKQHPVTLKISCAPGVTLPDGLGKTVPIPVTESEQWDKTIPAKDAVIYSTDPDTSLALLTEKQQDWQVIDVSECTVSDLLIRMNGFFDDKELRFKFTEKNGALLTGFEQNKKIILKGDFSEELEDKLAPILLARQKSNHPSGQLILLCNKEKQFNYMPVAVHTVSTAEKVHCLGGDADGQLKPYLAEPLSMIQARKAYLTKNPNANSDLSWEGLLNIQQNTKNLAPLNESTSVEEAYRFRQSRLQAVNSVLKYSPYVFLAGLSGVGKSTFVSKELKNNAKLYEGKNAIKNWAEDKTKGRKLLFLDEATLSSSNWTEFEGLFHKPPSILIDGIFYPLTSEHKVIFAGNPVSYGDERKLASLFQRHGNTVLFEPLPTSVLYEEILKPVFAKTLFKEDAAQLSGHFLEVYRFLVACSTTDVLISPRELQMMAIMTVAYCLNHPDAPIEETAKRYAYTLAKNLVPEPKRQEFKNRFEKGFEFTIPRGINAQKFLITPSRYLIKNQLDELLETREYRQEKNDCEAIQYGGLGGIILEGEPGIGKTELVINNLIAHDFIEMKDHSAKPINNKCFYRIPVSMKPAEKEALLIKACNEGAVVIIDEINSSPMMEKLLNDLLMGKMPGGGRPEKAGFMVIGTQNPVNMAGRRVISTALSRRMITEIIPPYPAKEMIDILIRKGVNEKQAQLLVDAYNTNKQKAQKEHLSPEPCFRDLMRLAEDVVTAQKIRLEQIKLLDNNTNTQPLEKETVLEEIQYITTKAVIEYKDYLTQHNPPSPSLTRVSNFFKKPTSSSRLEQLNKSVEEASSAREAIDVLDTFLNEKTTKYHLHSFASFFLDEVNAYLSSYEKQRVIPPKNGAYSLRVWHEEKTLLETLLQSELYQPGIKI